MVIYVDIDETICYYENDRDYYLAKPILTNINKINKLYDEGNEITYYTARGSVHKDKLEEKPAYDLMICDKTKRIEEI